jgi:hypothetical protein
MSDLPMPWRSLCERESLTELPLILAGPILRRTTPRSVTVWVALQAACQVNLRVFATVDNGDRIGNCLLWGSRETIALGAHLHIVAVTATVDRDRILTADRVYAYDLTFCQNDGRIPDRSLLQAMSAASIPNEHISYFAHGYPTFVLPANQLADLRLVHGSCRKPHGDGFDALSILDDLIAESAARPSERPQQLFLTGDQIYGDDVADPLLWAASHLSELLLGWTERLPIGSSQSGQSTDVIAKITWGDRSEIATQQAGFTAGLNNRQEKVSNHLLRWGEYAAIYLLAWSPVCWPQTFPDGRSISKHRQTARHWDRQVRQLQRFIDRLGCVRRALANIPLYTIFDDHEVSDDWNLNQAWCLRVLGKPLGRHVVQNALLAYAVFQGWGNTPDRFEVSTSGGKLLAAAQKWSASGGTDAGAHVEIARLVGMPQQDRRTGLPKFVSDGKVSILDRDPDAVVWNYTIESNCHEVIVLDTRTWRGYDLHRTEIDPPMLLSPTAFDRQLIQPLQATSVTTATRQTFIIAPTNLFSLAGLDWIHHRELKFHLADPRLHTGIFATDVGDAWNINTLALARLLTTLFAHRDRVVVLSGDIHYGAVARLSHHQLGENSSSVLVQLTASALRNESLRTKLLHIHLKDWWFPEPIRNSIGWNQPPQMLPFRSRLSSDDLNTPHDWDCTLEWIPRNRSTVAGFARRSSGLMPIRSTSVCSQLKQLLQRSIWWNSRWWQDGREVVGLNNLAVVQYRSQQIVQDLYWRAPWLPNQIVYSRFVASILPTELE